jgi:hypothetical protein
LLEFGVCAYRFIFGKPQRTSELSAYEFDKLVRASGHTEGGAAVYTCEDYNYSIRFPEGWELKGSEVPGTIVKAVHKDSKDRIAMISINVTPCVGPEGLGPNADIWTFGGKELFEVLREQSPGADFQLLDSGKTTVGGQHAIWMFVDCKSPPHATMLSKTYALLGYPTFYRISCSVSERDQELFELQQPVFEEALASFRFLKTP